MTSPSNQELVASISRLWERTRRDISAVKTPDGSRWTTESLHEDALLHHVNGGPARGAALIRPGESVTRLAVLDFDSHKGETPWSEMEAAAERVADHLTTKGYAPIPFRSSGGRGIHLWLVWEHPQDAYSVRMMLIEALQVCGFKNGTKGVARGEVEVFPKQNEIIDDDKHKGNQVILPLAGLSEPIDLEFGIPRGRDYYVKNDMPFSAVVPVRERPVRAADEAGARPETIETVRAALFAIPNGHDVPPDYDEWWRLGCATHEATGGSKEGLELFLEWSAQNPSHNEQFTRDRIWKYLSTSRAGNVITRASLFKRAQEYGYGALPEPSADGFEDEVDMFEGLEHHLQDAPGNAGGIAAAEIAEQGAPGELVDVEEADPFRRDNNGMVKTMMTNLCAGLMREDIVKCTLALDEFKMAIMITPEGSGVCRPIKDTDYAKIQRNLERASFLPPGIEILRRAVDSVAEMYKYDSAKRWLGGKEWDGVPRVSRFNHLYFKTADNPYTRATSEYMWTALAGRVLVPGIQADIVPIYIGEQGMRKSSAFEAMMPMPEFYGKGNFDDDDEKRARKQRGKLIIEYAELRGLNTKDNESIRDVITTRYEEWAEKYKEHITRYPRRCIYVGTENQPEILSDPTGNRRFNPMMVLGQVDTDAIERDRDQLWAEAAVLFQRHGVMWQEAEKLAKEIHAEFSVRDGWEPKIMAWLNTVDFDNVKNGDKPLTTYNVLTSAMDMDPQRIERRAEIRVGKILKNLGYERIRQRVNGVLSWVYVPMVPMCS